MATGGRGRTPLSRRARGKRRRSVRGRRRRGRRAKGRRMGGKGGEKVGVAESVSLSASSPFLLSTAPFDQQLQFFCKQFEFGNKFKISSLELEPVKGTCIAKLPKGVNQDVDALCKHVKDTFGPSWRSALCDGKLMEGEIDPGSPAILLISTSATRSLELLRGLRPLTMECRPAKLFAKHIKVEDQVSLLKSRVNIAGGTPSRIKKLMDMESLGLSRLSVIVLDMHRDAKGFSLFTLPQVRDEFWDLYRSHLHGRLIGGNFGSASMGRYQRRSTRRPWLGEGRRSSLPISFIHKKS
ncbi:unnamed protein product [Spirodela intermedia]|uniref:Uncharacterized protein n=1 Tax=Spirodela intermedia TaxID=51605 RepID=A0A7I8JD67_SPIIN|nr:unnamed protein product [Spirodela intermedia]CAA6667941.1 unnamed protein product [Spirodela intermedia]